MDYHWADRAFGPASIIKCFSVFIPVMVILGFILPWIARPVEAESFITAGPGRGYSRTLTVNSGQAPSILSDFPLLVSISNDQDLQAHVASSDGRDIIFTDPANTLQYPSEIENYSRSQGTLVAWVKVPSLADGTEIKMWYGIDAGPSKSDPKNVWDRHFKMVQHMTLDGENRILDSTANANNGVFQGKGTITAAAGIIGAALKMPGAAYIDCGSSSSLDFRTEGSYTWDTWINPSAFQPGGSGIIGKKHSPNVDHQGFELYAAGIGGAGGGGYQGGFAGGQDASQLRFQTTGGNSNSISSSEVGLSSGVWKQLTLVYRTNQDVRMYLNGSPIQIVVQPGATTAEFGSVTTTDDAEGAAYQDPLFIGWRRSAPAGADRGFFFGQIDEVEISDIARSADWIGTEYNNRISPSSFYSLSAESNEADVSAGVTDAGSRFVSVDGESDLSGLIGTDQKLTANIRIGATSEKLIVTLPAGTALNPAVSRIQCQSIPLTEVQLPEATVIAAFSFDPSGVTFSPPVDLTLKFGPADLPAGLAPGDLSLVYREGSGRDWKTVQGISINAVDHTLSAVTGSLTAFALVAHTNLPATQTGLPSGGSGSPNWLLIGINVAVVIAALVFVFARFGKKRSGSSKNKTGSG
jgi:hypothetical protein